MRSQLILLACCLLMACSDSMPELPAQTLPVSPPVNSEIRCDTKIKTLPDNANAGDLRAAFLGLLDTFDVCALRHNSMVDWLVKYHGMIEDQRLLENKDRV